MENKKNNNEHLDLWILLKEMIGTVEGPEDWAAESDHYLYGTPKRNQALKDHLDEIFIKEDIEWGLHGKD